MSQSLTIQQDVYGCKITARLVNSAGQPIDGTGATTKDLILTDPDGSEITRTGSWVGSPTAGVLEATLQLGDLAKPGTWHLQADLAGIPSGYTGRTQAVEFTVLPNP